MLVGDIVLSKLLDVVFLVGSKRGGGGEGEQTPSFSLSHLSTPTTQAS